MVFERDLRGQDSTTFISEYATASLSCFSILELSPVEAMPLTVEWAEFNCLNAVFT